MTCSIDQYPVHICRSIWPTG